MLPADPTLSVAERVDAACDHFEAEWKADRKPRIDEFVAAAPESDREELRQALLALQLELQGCSEAETSVSRSRVRSDDKPHPDTTVEQVKSTAASMGRVGRFEIRGVLGSGAFGKVYRAFDPQLSREVAVKVPLESTVKTDKERTQFLKEARSAANINHPNICQVHEVGEADGRPYIVMALVRGLSLSDTIKGRKEPLPEKQAALVVRKIALALAAAHDSGIVHRDLKPANVMFDRERKDIVVMDFGLARGPRLGDARGTQSGVIMGTPAYMSPEQARGESKGVGPAGDIFSLGVILYELLAGTRPFTGTATEVIGKILHVEPEKPSAVRPGVDPRLEAICLKAMAKDTAARFASMKEFAAALDAVLRKPAPTGPAVETAKAVTTRREGDDDSISTRNNLAEVFAALSDDRKQARVETAAAVEAAIAKHRTPRWLFLLVGLFAVGGFAALAGIVFFTRSDTVKVDLTVVLKDVDLADKSLTFFLNEEPISPDTLAKPVELKPGVHIFTVKRGKEIVKRVEIRVEWGRNPGIKVEDITPPKAESPPIKQIEDDLARWQGRWQCVTENSWGKVVYENDRAGNGPIQVVTGNSRELNKVSASKADSPGVSRFRINESVTPRTFDCDEFGPGKWRQSGIYEFAGNRLRLVYRFAKDAPPVRATWADIGKPDVHYYEFERITAEDGFVSLFNGKDFTGWKRVDGAPNLRGWAIRDGSIVRDKASDLANDGSTNSIWTQKPYGDFILEAEITGSGNSGIFFRNSDLTKYPIVGGLEMQINLPPSGKDPWQTGSIWGRQSPLKRNEKAGEWNTVRITARGPSITIELNGEVVNKLDCDAMTEPVRLAGQPELPPLRDMPRNGLIGLQAHAGDVSFRNIRIKELKEEGFVPLFNGKDLTGWTAESGDTENWKVRDGAITGIAEDAPPKPGAETWLLTDKEYQDFQLHYEFRTMTEKVNSGFGYRVVPREKPGNHLVPTHLQVEIFDKGVDRTGTLVCSLGPPLFVDAVPGEKQKAQGEWNFMEIEARGQSIRVKLNGHELLKDNLDNVITKGGLFPGLKRNAGRIGFQRLRGEIQFRNIQIKQLVEAKVAVQDPDRKAAEYLLSLGNGFVKVNGEERQIKNVSGLPAVAFRLTGVYFADVKKLDDNALTCLKDCVHLTELDLRSTKVTEKGLEIFRGKTNFTSLGLAYLRVTDEGMKIFKDNKKLRMLFIHDTYITDSGLSLFHDCKDLDTVWVGGTPITDVGMLPFRECKFLKWLDVRATKVTRDGVQAMKAALPACRIDADPDKR